MIIKQDLENYKWDTSRYVLIETGVRRDVKTGRLMRTDDDSKATKS